MLDPERLAQALEALAHDVDRHAGDVIGERIDVSVPGNEGAKDKALAADLLNAAADVRTGKSEPALLRLLLDRATALGSSSLTTVTRGAVEALLSQDG